MGGQDKRFLGTEYVVGSGQEIIRDWTHPLKIFGVRKYGGSRQIF
jgi:hypothetical protein